MRYTAGKADWAAHGLPREGQQAEAPQAGVYARRDVPTCRITDRLGETQDRVRAAGAKECIVVNTHDVVLGFLSHEALEADPEMEAEAVMEPGPDTIRPNTPVETALKRLRAPHRDSLLVTTADGQLIGLLFRHEIEEAKAV